MIRDLWMVLVMVVGIAYADVTEDFDGWSDGSYGATSTYSHSGVGDWESYNSMTNSSNARSGNCVRFNDDSSENEYLLFKGLDGNGKDGGIGTISFWYRHWDGDGSGVQFKVQYKAGAGDWTDVGSTITVTSTTYSQYSQSVDLDADDVLVKVISVDDAERLCIDDFSITDYGTSADPEPSNHVTSFTATADGHNEIDLTWSDNNGSQAAAGHLVLINTSGSFSDPVDGTAQSNDTDLSDNAGVYNVSSGTQAYSWTSLNSETTYYFKIWPYTNSGEDIDYKTDGTVPTANATTGTAPASPTASTIYISEVSDASSSGSEYIEIYNNSSNAVDLSSSKIVQVDNSDNSSEYVFDFGSDGSGDTHIPANGLLIVTRGDDQSAFETTWSTSLGSSVTFNSGNSNLYIGTGTAHRWRLRDGGTANTDDGTLLDDTDGAVAGSSKRHYQDPVDTWTSDNSSNATPGTLEGNQDTSLPVELSLWTATSNNGRVELLWSTDSEIENQGFIISRKEQSQVSFLELASFESDPGLIGHGSTSARQTYSYIDKNIRAGTTYEYRLSDVDYSGKTTHHRIVTVTARGVADAALPVSATIQRAYPNPFNPTVNIELNISHDASSPVQVAIYDLNGRLVRTIGMDAPIAGVQQTTWNGLHNEGHAVESGIYIAQVVNGRTSEFLRLTLLR